MKDNRMNIQITGESFPMAKIDLDQGEKIYIQSGAMVYKSNGLELKTRLNAEGSGIGKFFKALGRSMTSGENIFITEVVANQPGNIALAPPVPGKLLVLPVSGEKQYRLNDGAFLALDGSANYKMEIQTLGKAIFSRTGGLFVMTTFGEGRLILNAFGSIEKITLNGETVTVDNGHVLAWDSKLNYNLHFENKFLQSIGTGEGLVNTFSGYGDIYIQSLNLENFARQLSPLLQTQSSDGSGVATIMGLLDN